MEKAASPPKSPILKHFALLYIPFLAFLFLFSLLVYRIESNSIRTIIETGTDGYVSRQAKELLQHIRFVVSDLVILAKNHDLQMMLERKDYDTHRNALAQEFMHVCEVERVYDQIRFIDTKGMEVVRVNYSNGRAVVVPEEELQSKKDRYYFREGIALGNNQIYISPFDLNIENGEIEQPLKPMIRFITPVFDFQDRKRGVLVLNYLGKNLLKELKESLSFVPGEAMLVNSEGYWLKGLCSEDEWGFMYEDRMTRRFGHRFPDAWQRIEGMKRGQLACSLSPPFPLCWKRQERFRVQQEGIQAWICRQHRRITAGILSRW